MYLKTLKEACSVVAGRDVLHAGNPFGKTSKMPGYSYGLDAFQCKRGGELAQIPGTICNAHCYAKRNFYATWTPVVMNREGHQAAVEHPDWEEAMVRCLTHYVAAGDYFRWMDSGDLPSLEVLQKIVSVCKRTPGIKHWLATRERTTVFAWVDGGGVIPPNLVIRMSADFIAQRLDLTDHEVFMNGLVSSSVHRPGQFADRGRSNVECKSHERDHVCGPCRACWSPDVENVSYQLTEGAPQVKRGKRSASLAIVA